VLRVVLFLSGDEAAEHQLQTIEARVVSSGSRAGHGARDDTQGYEGNGTGKGEQARAHESLQR
jgi:hypothetical protein